MLWQAIDQSLFGCRYKLPIRECLNGLVQGMLHGWLDLSSFSMEEYEYYEVCNSVYGR